MRPFLFLVVAVLLGSTSSRAETWHFESQATQTSLIELFTSEGCSSCPPAERWLGVLREEKGLWRDFVPLAFHVNYWDRLGWRDRFATKAWTDRQYAYAAGWRSGSVYTPCFVRDGAEWRTRSLRPTDKQAGVLTCDYDGRVVHAKFTATPEMQKPENLEVHAALLGGGIKSKVAAGENRGATLPHEFVVLDLASGGVNKNFALPKTAVDGVTRYALAVWVTRRGEATPLQATGGWLTE